MSTSLFNGQKKQLQVLESKLERTRLNEEDDDELFWSDNNYFYRGQDIVCGCECYDCTAKAYHYHCSWKDHIQKESKHYSRLQ